MGKVLYVVMPAYNEEEIIEESVRVVSKKLAALIKNKKISKASKIMIIDDGSKDQTLEILKGLVVSNKFLVVVKLSRNCGHQNAMYAGLMEAVREADMVISMDADLQDDVGMIDLMVDEYLKGNEIVYGVRNNRDKDSFFKRNTALLFYSMMSFLGVEIVSNHADFRLMSKRVIEALANFKEVNLFLRGIIPMLGFKSSKVYYQRQERRAGVSKYNLKRMIGLALDGVTSFSVKPIRFIVGIGFGLSFVSFVYLVYVVMRYFSDATLVDGWTSIIALVCFFGSFQILCIGVIGEYIAKIYLETKQRPKYFIECVWGNEGKV